MGGKFLLCLVLIGGLAASWVFSLKPRVLEDAGHWVMKKVTGADPLYSPDQFEIDLVDRINYQRKANHQPLMKVDMELEKWLKTFSESISASNLDGVVTLLQNQQPRYFQVRIGSARAQTLRDLPEQFRTFSSSIEPENEHMAVLTRRQQSGFGYEAVVVTGQRLTNFSPEALNERKKEIFFSICPHCKHQHPCKAPIGQRGINLDCPRCGLDYGVLAPDAKGQFRYVNEYLTGYQPPARYAEDSSRMHELYTIWNSVVSRCVYTKDSTPDNPTRDSWQTALETMTRGKGDCEDSAILLADWLMSRGFDVRVALGRFGDLGQHAWCVARIDGIEYLLESTEGHPNPNKPPYVSDLGSRYVPETLFDRDAIYVRGKPKERFDGTYWNNKTWVRILPRHLFDDPAHTVNSLASAANTGGQRSISIRRAISNDQASLPMPAFDRLRDLNPGAAKWQFNCVPERLENKLPIH